MKNLTYNNINSHFTFENVCSQLIKFWIREIITLNNHNNKIWITLTVVNQENKSFTLIQNLPFNISDFTDITIVIKQIFETNTFSNKDILNNISFKYYIENTNKYSFYYKAWFKNIFFYIILIFVTISLTIYTLNIFLDISQTITFETLSINSCDTNIKEIVLEKETKRCIFDTFIKLFDSKGYKYVPSKFIESNLKSINHDFNLLEYIVYNQYLILEYATIDSREYIDTLNDIFLQYEIITDRLLVN